MTFRFLRVVAVVLAIVVSLSQLGRLRGDDSGGERPSGVDTSASATPPGIAIPGRRVVVGDSIPLDALPPLLEAAGEQRVCIPPRDAAREPGKRTVGMSFGDAPSRQIMLKFGEDGMLESYSDSRGDLRLPYDSIRQIIRLDVRREVAMVLVAHPDGSTDGHRVPYFDALHADELDRPQLWIERIVGECA